MTALPKAIVKLEAEWKALKEAEAKLKPVEKKPEAVPAKASDFVAKGKSMGLTGAGLGAYVASMEQAAAKKE